ncbi:MAG: hypothetical protein JW734_00695 [Candidatus Omnitrophica bacterium]|nr:hypothetical protein [Candidatus Omnitrophota bacterium]
MRLILGFLRDIKTFYTKDMCGPYAFSFLLTLVIYSLEFVLNQGPGWASVTAFLILFGYYLKNLQYYQRGALTKDNLAFFILFLTAKIATWFAILVVLFLFRQVL